MRPEVEQELSHILLTELLAYQFASPVRWIETQDVILSDFNAERLVEVGPSPTLANMAQRTIKAKYETYDAALSLQRQILAYSKDTKEIYYTPDVVEEVEAPAAPAAPAAAPVSAEPTPTPVAAAPVAAPAAPAAAAAAVEDAPVSASLVLHVIVAHKLKKSLDQVPMAKAIKDLVGGKSTVQNEILGDLGKEFGSAPEKPEEIPLGDLADQFQDSFNGQLGKHTSTLIAKLISSKMPGGYSMSSARAYLQERWGLGPGRQDSVLLVALANEPKARFPGDAEAKAFLDSAAQQYASTAGINLSAASASSGGAGGAGGSGGAVVDSAALEKLNKDQKYLVQQQLELFANYLKVDLRKGDKQFVAQKEATALLQKELDLWNSEHGDFYASGIKPAFSPLKARVYDSYWNWARQDCLRMFYDIIFGRLSNVDRETVSRCISIMNRANPILIDFMQFYIDHVPTEQGATFKLAQELGAQLLENTKEAVGVNPVYKDVTYPTGPKTTIDKKGNISYEEVPRPAVRKLEQYVYEMAAGSELTKDESSINNAKGELSVIYKKIAETYKDVDTLKLDTIYAELIKTIDEQIAKEKSSASTVEDKVSVKGMKPDTVPYLHLKKRIGESWKFDRELSGLYLDGLEHAAKEGITFANKYVLVTGAGAGSIGADILQGLLSGGAKVIVTTSRYSKKVTEFYQGMYTTYGAAGSTLVVVPFNQGSKSDVNALIEYIYNDPKQGGLGWDLDFVVPFAAIPENGIEIDGIDSRSELAHRLMMTNLLRLLGNIKQQKSSRGYETRPAQVILPMSPNHGTFGGDGLYSESKSSLEMLFNRWYSESWGSYLTICGAIIGWTRGTGLMSQNNIIAEGVEKYGVRTFSQKEMAFNILGLMTHAVARLCQQGPVFADLNGGFQYVDNLKAVTTKLRTELLAKSDLRRAVSLETSLDQKVVMGPDADLSNQKVFVKPRANHKFEFPTLKSYKELKEIAPELEGVIDPERVVVVTGFAEVGPWGNSRTRWDMEAHGQFSLEGAIEMAWIMGLIKHHNGPLKGQPYSGWVDTKTNEPVDDKDVKQKYESYILEHSGIRLIEPELFQGYDPKKKQFLQEIIVEHDLEPIVASKEVAEQFKLEQGDKVEVFEISEGGEWTVRFLKGATLYVPKALEYNRLVAGQIPTGWDARRYGISEDIISQVDPITLFVLVSTVEALLAAGITDPYEFYKYVHLSEVGNTSGSGMGGVSALRGMFKERYLDKPVQNDVLQESFINTMSAWVNMLLLSSSGPIKTPVGACATALESVDSAVELILSGRAKVVIAGGYDDFQEEGSHEFGNMNATSNSLDEMAHGREPNEMSRPNTNSRSGFMEAQGSGIQVLMNAKLAIEMGVPIYGIVALTATATDKIGRSIPAPGRGIMTAAREASNDLKYPYRVLDIKYRKRQLESRRSQIKQWTESEYAYLANEVDAIKADSKYSEEDVQDFIKQRTEEIENDAYRQEKDAMRLWGHEFYLQDPRISPIRGALAIYNLDIDDIGVGSFHGTSTKANDKNESNAVNSMLNHLGRSKGNPIMGIFQKYLTGHPKGAAAAWMMNGVIQVLNTGLVPGNRNADNIDSVLQQFDKIVYPSVSIQTTGIKAAMLQSFGFGQKGAMGLVIHPDFFLASLSESAYNEYSKKMAKRYNKAYRYLHNGISKNTLFVAKNDPPYDDSMENLVYLDPLARVDAQKKTGDLAFSAGNKRVKAPTAKSTGHTADILKALATQTVADSNGKSNVGVDVEELSSLNLENTTFIDRNFTEAEQSYCNKAADKRASYTGTWSAKEAVFKSLGVESRGGGAELKSIEIVRSKSGAPEVVLHGDALAAANKAGVKSVKVSISHNDLQAVAVAVSTY